MNIRQLVHHWQSTSNDDSPKVNFQIKVPIQDAARLAALADLFPALKSEEIVAELLHCALDEVQEAFPYIQGEKQVSEDELGNPIYEDDGYTPRFLTLMREHLAKLKS